MSQFYNPKRGAAWNYGGKNWKLSRSKLELFLDCPKCFYLDNKLGTKRPPGFPFNLNSAVDHLLKKEFDIHRAKNQIHPLMAEYGIDAIPYSNPKMDEWRENFVGVQYNDSDLGFTISGAVDDIWVNPEGELIVVDYKSTSKDEEVNIDADWQRSYKNQMEIYQWILRKNGFKVSNTGYFVYANGKKDREAFEGKLEFDVTILPYTGDDSWVDDALIRAKACLETGDIPNKGENCDYCSYRDTVSDTEERFSSPQKKLDL